MAATASAHAGPDPVSAVWQWSVEDLPADTTPPDTTIAAGPSGTMSSTSASFTFLSSETGTFECALDSAAFVACSSPETYSALAPGPHAFEVRAVDAAGNRDASPARRTWTVVGHPIVLAAGDIADCIGDGEEETAAIIDGYPDATVAALGDLAYPNGTSAEFQACYEPTWGRHKSRTRPAVGNHEYGTIGASGYFGYFGAAAGPAGKGWYSYDLGGWHVVVLNSNCTFVDCSATSEQLTWLRADLAAHPVDCTLAYWHHPLFTSGLHANDSDLPLVGTFWDELYAGGVDVVISAHDHDYERFAPQTPTAEPDTSHGIRQFVVGTGGANVRGFGVPRPNSEVREGATYGVTKLVLRPAGYDWQFLAETGASFVDTGSGSCHGRPDHAAPSPPTLSSSHATGWSNDNTVDVTWTGASDDGSGVDGFSYSWTQQPDSAPDLVKDVEETADRATGEPLEDGEWWFHLRTVDNAGNWSDAVHVGPFRIDTVAPATGDDAPAGWRKSAVTVSLSPVDDRSGVAATQYRVDGGPLETATSVVVPAPVDGSNDGVHTVEYRSTDLAGNVEAFRSATVRIDTGKPTTVDDAPSGWQRAPVTITLRPSDARSGVASTEHRVNGGPFVDGMQVTLTTDALHVIEYRSRDAAGNAELLRTATVGIDRGPPANPTLTSPSHTPGAWSNESDVHVSWSGAADSLSGVDGFSYSWTHAAGDSPDETKEPDGSPATATLRTASGGSTSERSTRPGTGATPSTWDRS